MSNYANLILGKKFNIQIYQHLILGFIKYFMKVRLDEVSLALLGKEDIQDSIAPIRANQINYSISIEELCYAQDISILPNIQESLQGRYL